MRSLYQIVLINQHKWNHFLLFGSLNPSSLHGGKSLLSQSKNICSLTQTHNLIQLKKQVIFRKIDSTWRGLSYRRLPKKPNNIWLCLPWGNYRKCRRMLMSADAAVVISRKTAVDLVRYHECTMYKACVCTGRLVGDCFWLSFWQLSKTHRTLCSRKQRLNLEMSLVVLLYRVRL